MGLTVSERCTRLGAMLGHRQPGLENATEGQSVDDGTVRIDRGLVALRWGAAFGVVGAAALIALSFVFALFLGAAVDVTSGIKGQISESWTAGPWCGDAAVGPLTCIALSSGLAWVIARSPGTTNPAWGIGLLSGIVGVLAGYAALQLTVFCSPRTSPKPG